MWIERLYEDRLRKVVTLFPALYLSGARQVGKTSLVRHLFPNYSFISLDNPNYVHAIRSNPDQLFAQFSLPIIIDEAQYAPELFRYIKQKIDENRSLKGQYILTGSQHFLMMKEVSDSLAGRCAILELSPLLYLELKNSKLADSPLIDILWRGGYPELWANKTDEGLWLSSYIATYLERDVRNLLHVGSLVDFDRFLRLLATRTAQQLTLSSIARDIGIAVSTVKQWVSVLETSSQISLLEPFYRNIGKRLVKTPKIYFNDTGLACLLMGIRSPSDLAHSPLLGAIWETYVYQQLNALLQLRYPGQKLWYWRTSTGEEVDFMIEIGGSFKLFEAKYTVHPSSSDTKGFHAFTRYYRENEIISASIVSPTEIRYSINTFSVLPLADLAV